MPLKKPITEAITELEFAASARAPEALRALAVLREALAFQIEREAHDGCVRLTLEKGKIEIGRIYVAEGQRIDFETGGHRVTVGAGDSIDFGNRIRFG